MRTSLFSFNLPDELIAQEPPETRGTSRLLVMKRFAVPGGDENLLHRSIADLPEFIDPGSVMVFNDTRVRKARFFAVNEETGGKGEFLFIRPTSEGEWDCVVDKARKKREGQRWVFPGNVTGTIVGTPASDRRLLRFDSAPGEDWFENHGHIPLPPYMKRPDNADDARRYQTVYARETGSAAAPTAGLHFTEDIMAALEKKGVIIVWVTLEVGLGTFSPVRVDNILDHPMHTERYRIPDATATEINRARTEGRKVIGVGTTSVRTLEASWAEGAVQSGEGCTDIFIYPGYEFHAVDTIFTNFHTPKSSLLMMISAFCGRERLLSAYETAVAKKYRFFSYGDAMLIL